MAPRSLWDAGWIRETSVVGYGTARRHARVSGFPAVGPRTCECLPARAQRVRRGRPDRQRMGMDLQPLWAVRGISAVSVLSRVFRQFLRRKALRAQRRLDAHRRQYAAPVVSQLVSAALPIHLRGISLCERMTGEEMVLLTTGIVPHVSAEFATDVRNGLMKRGQKELPSKYLYDEVGSRLFEVISALPEYGVTRADERLLRKHAAEIVERVPGAVTVAELGSGSGKKTRWILEALSHHRRTAYYPIEISATALAMCRRELADIDSISIVGFEREYLDGLLEVAARRQHGQRILVLFLGSTIGNFDRPADVGFLREVRLILQPGDALLVGTDLEKPVPQLIDAYNNPLGVTAAFK